jgi:hypothetical protein
MVTIIQCPITGFEAEEFPPEGDFRRIRCRALGGAYEITGTADELLTQVSSGHRLKIATHVINERRSGIARPSISSATLAKVALVPPLKVMEKVHRLYRYVASQSPLMGTRLPYSGLVTPALTDFQNGAAAWTESPSFKEVRPLVVYAKESGHFANLEGAIQLTVPGWAYIEQLEWTERASQQAFVAMWFGPEVSGAYNDGIAPAVLDTGYSPMRIDQKEHSNRIDDEIIAEIRRSRFLIADFTCGVVDDGTKTVAIPRGGVYYEAGFAQGLGIPVIWMCRQDHIEHVHFDTRQFNHITWTDPADLRVKLKNRIGAVLGDGPLSRQ